VQLDEAAHERQADAEAALSVVECSIGLHIHVKDEWQEHGRDSRTRVLDAEHGVGAVGAECHANPAARRRVLDRVGHDVGDHLLEPHGVAIDPDGLGAHVDVPS
jgi:hypothetical protein